MANDFLLFSNKAANVYGSQGAVSERLKYSEFNPSSLPPAIGPSGGVASYNLNPPPNVGPQADTKGYDYGTIPWITAPANVGGGGFETEGSFGLSGGLWDTLFGKKDKEQRPSETSAHTASGGGIWPGTNTPSPVGRGVGLTGFLKTFNVLPAGFVFNEGNPQAGFRWYVPIIGVAVVGTIAYLLSK